MFIGFRTCFFLNLETVYNTKIPSSTEIKTTSNRSFELNRTIGRYLFEITSDIYFFTCMSEHFTIIGMHIYLIGMYNEVLRTNRTTFLYMRNS